MNKEISSTTITKDIEAQIWSGYDHDYFVAVVSYKGVQGADLLEYRRFTSLVGAKRYITHYKKNHIKV